MGQVISLLRGFVIFLPLVFLLSHVGGITGVWLAFPVTEMAVSVVGCGFYIRFRDKMLF
jgi:Na+-driven multidrug efflux pump